MQISGTDKQSTKMTDAADSLIQTALPGANPEELLSSLVAGVRAARSLAPEVKSALGNASK